jgi:hypothetical protein
LSDFDIKTPTVKASAFKYVKEKRRQNKNKKGEGK